MAGVSEMPFRRLARRFGAAHAPTELVSAKGLIHGQARTLHYLRHHVDETPFWVQLFGGDAADMVAGGQRAVALGAKILDINMGCPVRKVTRHGAGSSLLCDPAAAAELVRAMVCACHVPITVKIRAGWDAHSLTFIELASRFEDAGASAIALHARTRAQGYSGHAQWNWIAELVAATSLPVIGNGDAFTADAARALQQQTGCAAVMVGRGALGDPWIFSRLATGADHYPTPVERWHVVRDHFAAHQEHVGDALRAIKRFRQHLMWYARGITGASHFRRAVTQINEQAELLEVCEAFFSAADYERPDRNEGNNEDVEFEVGNALG